MAQHVFTNNTATTNEADYDINVVDVYLVANDTLSGGDLLVGFDASPSEDSNYMIVKSGEKFENLGISCRKLHVKSSTGSVVFRVYGKKNLL